MVEYTNQQSSGAELINTFIGGMNLDTSESLLPQHSYREAYNLRLSADTVNGTGTLHNIQGVKYYLDIRTNLPTLPDGKVWENIKVAHVDSIRQYGVLIVTASVDGKTSYFIFRFINKDDLLDGQDGSTKLIFGPCRTELSNNVSSVTRYEDDDNIKFYYADGTLPIRVINISPSVDSTRQMLDDGAFGIYPTALLSLPEYVGMVAGNLKTGAYQYGYQLSNKNGAETEVSPLTQVVYTNASLLGQSSSSNITGSNKGTSSGKGILIKVKVNDNKYDRIRIISIFQEDATEVPHILILKDMLLHQEVDGTVKDVAFVDIDNRGLSDMTVEEFNMITSIHFIPKLLESKNNHLFASNILYQDNSFNIDYDARAYSYVDFKDNRLVTTLQNESGDNELIISYDDVINGTIVVPEKHDCINPYAIISKPHNTFAHLTGTLLAHTKDANGFRIWGGEGINIKYAFVVSDLVLLSGSSTEGDTKAVDFEGVWLYNIDTVGRPINKQFNKLTTKRQIIPNYAEPLILSKLKSLQRDELYRYGIIFYNKFNQASPVKWIADIRIPAASEKGFESFIKDHQVSFLENKSDLTYKKLVARPIGILFEVKNMPAGAVAYEIVRCKRTDSDRSTITQGICGTLAYPEPSPNSKMVFPTQLMTLTKGCFQDPADGRQRAFANNVPMDDAYRGEANFVDNTGGTALFKRYADTVLSFSSPEVCYNIETLKQSIAKTGLLLQMVNYIFPDAVNNGDIITYGSDTGIYAKIGSLKYKAITGGGEMVDTTQYIPFFNFNWELTYDVLLFELSTSYKEVGINTSTLGSASPTIRCSSGDYSLVKDIVFPKEATWSSYGNKFDFIDGVGSFVYDNWIINGFSIGSDSAYHTFGVLGPKGRSIVLNTDIPGVRGGNGMLHKNTLSIGTNKRKLSLKSLEIYTETLPGTNSFHNESIIGTMLCNLRKSTIPYDGYGYGAKQFNTYVSIGAYATSENRQITSFSGDIYINLFKYVNQHYATGGNEFEAHYKGFVLYVFPVESPINLAMLNGSELNRYVLIEPSNVNGLFVLSKPLYVYNSIYSVEPQTRIFLPSNIYDEYNKTIDVRTLYSLNKSNDETVDSWTKFKPLNYLDVDTRYGSINNLRTFGNELIFWLSNAVGKFSVNERSLIQDDSNSSLLLGTGGTLSRYDYLATTNGMKVGHLDSDCLSDTVLYWYDYDKHELCLYLNGSSVVCLSKVKYVLSYLNKLSLLKDKQNIKPMLTFDKYYNEIIATLSNSESLVYNEAISAFTGFYSIVPDYSLAFNKGTYLIKNAKLYEYNANTSNNGFNDEALPIHLKYIVNKDYKRTKVFDNLEFTGFLNRNLIVFYFEADSILSKELHAKDISVRENNFRSAIPRAISDNKFANRMRGRVLNCQINYELRNSTDTNIITIRTEDDVKTNTLDEQIVINNNSALNAIDTADLRFELPYIRTTYRLSQS